MLEESIAVAPSEEQGNIPNEAPSEPQPVAPAEPEPVVPTATVEEFELPDGRKVTASELYKEHTENLLPEFTRRSQELAELKKGTLPNNEPPKSPYADPNYIPQNYEEIIAQAEQRALQRIEEREQQRIESQKALEAEVSSQIADVKKIDPTVNENQLFLHATKYGFRDLRVAHQNMMDMANIVKNAQKQAVENVQKRNDPVSVAPGATGARPNPSNFSSAVDYLRSLKT